MFTRIVKMVFEPQHIPTFLNNFEQVKAKIRGFEGCEFLELYQDKHTPEIFFTYSKWTHEDRLEDYRHSDLFKTVWGETKPLFKEKAQAWSVDTIHQLS